MTVRVGPQGYRNYRGRTSKWKLILSIALAAVILAAVIFIIIQENLIYDEAGRPHLPVPEQPETTSPETPPEEEDLHLDIQIQEPEDLTVIHARRLPVEPLTKEYWHDATGDPAFFDTYDSVVVTVKDDLGKVYFDSAAAANTAVSIRDDTMEALAEIIGNETWHTVARFACCLDPIASRSDVESMGLKNTGGYIFYDLYSQTWLDPAKPAARQYLVNLAKEAAELGFDEILLTDVSYPTEGKLDKVAYSGEDYGKYLRVLLLEMRSALTDNGMIFSVELPAEVIRNGSDSASGQVLAEIVGCADRIYAATTAIEAPGLKAAVQAAAGERTVDFVPVLGASDGDIADGSFLRK